MKSKIRIIESTMEDGVFSSNKKFNPDLSEEQREKKLKEVRINFGNKNNFNGLHMIKTTQKGPTNNYEYEDGLYYVIKEYPNKEDYLEDIIVADVVLIEEKLKGIVVGHVMADCPIVIAEDRKKGVTGMAHCGGTYVNREVPKNIIEALQKEYNSSPEDIYVYIGSNAKKESYIYDRWPVWATNKVWNNHIEEKEGNYHIDLDGAITEQLEKLGIKNIEISKYDTVKDKIHYSHSASYHGNKDKFGQNYVGFLYE